MSKKTVEAYVADIEKAGPLTSELRAAITEALDSYGEQKHSEGFADGTDAASEAAEVAAS